MTTRTKRPLAALALASALALPAVATARPDHAGRGHGKGPNKVHTVSYNLKGTVSAKAEDGTITVTVAHSNRHGRAWRNQVVQLDLSAARVVVRDVNGDGERDAADVSVGDIAKLQVRLPRNATPGTSPLAVKRAVFRTPDPAEDGEDEREQQPAV